MNSLRRKLKISDEEYDSLIKESDYLCWICGNEEFAKDHRSQVERNLSIDHDHQTEAFRGLLCTSCNRKLGGINDPIWLYKAAKYLAVSTNAFRDRCTKCFVSYRPTKIVSTLNGQTIFEYHCKKCNRYWECFMNTLGIPGAWKASGSPVLSGHLEENESTDDILNLLTKTNEK